MYFYGSCCFLLSLLCLATPACFAVSYGVIALIFRKNPYLTDKQKWNRITALAFILIFLTVGGYLLYDGSYWKSQGYADYYRMPLEYPYELESFDSLRTMYIGKWKTNDIPDYVGDISMYQKTGHLLVGSSTSSEGQPQWFIFDCQSGDTQKYETYDEYLSALKDKGLETASDLFSVRENWDHFWGKGEWKN